MAAAAIPTWQQLNGSNNWDGLLDPLHISLRKQIIKCGDFCDAAAAAFNGDQNSKYCGTSRFRKNTFFKKAGLEEFVANYKVSSFIYATAGSNDDDSLESAVADLLKMFILHSLSRNTYARECNWMGYIAVSTDEATKSLGRREIYVVWRGTSRNLEWIDNIFGASPVTIDPLLPQHTVTAATTANVNTTVPQVPQVAHGWRTIYTASDPNSTFTKLSARQQLLENLRQLVVQYHGEELSIIVTGHSLGASLAVLSAFDIVLNGIADDNMVTSIAFGCPMVGNKAFNDMAAKFPNLKVLRVTNTLDLVPMWPAKLAQIWNNSFISNKLPQELLDYVPTGIEILVDTSKSPYLKATSGNLMEDVHYWHNLQSNLHMVAGWNGSQKLFKLQVKRCLALINKSSGYLKDEYSVPESWWAAENKGMILNAAGNWVLAEPEYE